MLNKTIAVIFASPSRFNSGMHTVDQAWEDFHHRHFSNFQFQRYRFTDICYNKDDNGRFKCLIQSWDEILKADVILYWGDFLHMYQYISKKSKDLIEFNVIKDYSEAEDIVLSRLLMVGESKETLNKVISFGTNFLLDQILVRNHKRKYYCALKKFLENSKSCMPRDIYSANLVSHYNKNTEMTQGVDCALLSNLVLKFISNDFENWKGKGKSLGVFFGRSSSRVLKRLLFARSINKNLNFDKIEWISWLEEGKPKTKQALLRKLASLILNLKKEQFKYPKDQVEMLREYKLIITDTYHLAVNAWAVGVPAVCIAEIYRKARKDNVNSGYQFNWRDKRYMHYLMYDMLDFYMHGEELDYKKEKHARLNHIKYCVENESLLLIIHEKLNNQVLKSGEILKFKIIEILNEQ